MWREGRGLPWRSSPCCLMASLGMYSQRLILLPTEQLSEMGRTICNTQGRESVNYPWYIMWIKKKKPWARNMNDKSTEEETQRGKNLKWLSKCWGAIYSAIRLAIVKNSVQSWRRFEMDTLYVVGKNVNRTDRQDSFKIVNTHLLRSINSTSRSMVHR